MSYLIRMIKRNMTGLPPLPEGSLKGKVIVITGANSGIGLEIARHLAVRDPAKLILAVRSEKSGIEARDTISALLPKDHTTDLQVWLVDLASFASVKEFANKCAGLERLDAVAMNAGMLGGGDMAMTVDGHELITQVNVLSPILLTLLLAPLLRRSLKGDRSTTRCLPNIDIPRIIFTGSDVAEIAVTTGLDSKHPLRGLDDEATYKAEHRYYQSKLSFHSVIRQVIPLFPQLVITDVNPGLVNSPFFTRTPPPMAMRAFLSLVGRTPEQGARNISMALLTLTASSDYYSDCKPSGLRCTWLDTPEGIEFGDKLWKESCAIFETVAPGTLVAAGIPT